MTLRLSVLAPTLLLWLGASCAFAADGAAVRPPAASGPLGNERLSDEHTITRWAHADFRSRLRARPSGDSGAVGRLRYDTEDGFPEVYLALSSRVDEKGRVWIRVRIPARPNGQKGWVRRNSLGPFSVVRKRLVINRKTLRATLFRGKRRIWSARVGVGKRGTVTPAGRFYVREKIRVRQRGSFYGPWAIGTSAYSPTLTDWPGGGVVGIHGTSLPQLIPGRPSHGCVRVRNRPIRRLARLLPIGTPIRVF